MLYNENPNIKLRSATNLLVNAKYTEKTVYVMHKPNALLINIATNFEYIFYSFHILSAHIALDIIIAWIWTNIIQLL